MCFIQLISKMNWLRVLKNQEISHITLDFQLLLKNWET